MPTRTAVIASAVGLHARPAGLFVGLAGEATRAGVTVTIGRPGEEPAELRLLPWLATHLSFREIGARLYVSRNTIKTQAISVYRKLGVSSRSEAIECASRLGLLDADEHRLLARLDAEGRG